MNARFELRPVEHLHAPDTKRNLNRTLFSEVAPKYDFITRALSFGRDAAWKKAMTSALPELDHPRCADLACGTGDLSRLLIRRYPEGTVSGLDLTPAMLERARRQTTPNTVQYLEGSMEALPFADRSLDVVTGGYALRNAPDLGGTLDEIHRVLRPGGTAAFLDFSKPARPVGQRLTHRILKLWGGLWGLLLHGNPDVYGYIADSLDLYPDRLAIRTHFAERGFRLIKSKRFYFGLLEYLIVEKEAERVA